jgi:membrane-associated phospholipid phosphatase
LDRLVRQEAPEAERVQSAQKSAPAGFWPVDKVIFTYTIFVSVLILIAWNRLPEAPWLLGFHAAATAIIIWEVKFPNFTTWIFRNWYPLPYVATCYKEMALLVPALRRSNLDQWLANLDHAFWRVHPTVWLERIQTPVLTEFLQVVYTLFVPAVLLVPVLLWRRARFEEFQYLAFLIALGYLASYCGYLMVPARGPRFLLRDYQHAPLQGLWLFHWMQGTLDRLESAQYDCFPSGHTELTILACWSSRLISNRLFQVYFAYTLCIIFATVYLRYHYTVDLLAGAVLAFLLIRFAPVLYQKLSKGV